MNLLETITEQLRAKPLPVVAVSVAAVPCPDTPIILMLHWHGFIEEKIIEVEEAQTVAYKPIPSLALQVNDRWNDLVTLDRAAMEAGWELGAWDIARAERAGCARPGAKSSEALECLQAFGSYPSTLQQSQTVISDAPDAAELVDLAVRRGYLSWMFRPVYRGIWAEFANDRTLGADGTRTPPCPVESVPPVIGRGKTVYRFGIPNSSALVN